jgi:hypothetical protein
VRESTGRSERFEREEVTNNQKDNYESYYSYWWRRTYHMPGSEKTVLPTGHCVCDFMFSTTDKEH